MVLITEQILSVLWAGPENSHIFYWTVSATAGAADSEIFDSVPSGSVFRRAKKK